LSSAAALAKTKGAFGINNVQRCRIIYFVNESQGFAEIDELHVRIELHDACTFVSCGREM
jgi:hypothetical protein